MRKIEEFHVEFAETKKEKEKESRFFTEAFFDVFDSIKGAVIVVFLVFAFVFRVVGVDGDSMNPTLNNGDWLAVSGGIIKPERGDIVVVTQPWERNVPIIKRVIAIENDVVDIDFVNHLVYINGEVIDEPYRPRDPQSRSSYRNRKRRRTLLYGAHLQPRSWIRFSGEEQTE